MDYPLLNLFLTMLYFFLWIAWLFLLFRIILDIFRSHDLGGWGKARLDDPHPLRPVPRCPHLRHRPWQLHAGTRHAAGP